MEFEFYAVTHQGLVRQNNEDFFLIPSEPIATEGLCIVADGMGGHKAGEVASRLACDTFAEQFYLAEDGDTPVADRMKIALNQANNKVVAAQKTNIFYSNMGTTIIACYISENRATFMNVGDSRAYLVRKGRTEQITSDHSMVQELLSREIITAEEAENHPQKNIITRAIGLEDGVKGDIFSRILEKGDCIVLCTDGLTKHIPMENLGILFDSTCTSESIAVTLRDLALARGGTDNVTIVIIRCL